MWVNGFTFAPLCNKRVVDLPGGTIEGTVINSEIQTPVGSLATVVCTPLDEKGEALTVHPDEQGKFKFEGLNFGRYAVTCTTPGYDDCSPQAYTISEDSSLLFLNIALKPRKIPVTIQLVDPGGNPFKWIETVKIEGSGLDLSCRTNFAGIATCEIPTGTYNLSLVNTEYFAYSTLQLNGTEEELEVTLILERRWTEWSFDETTGALNVWGAGPMVYASYSSLDACWNRVKSDVKSVNVSGLSTIGDSAFSGCTNLKSVSISNSVTSIGSQAFGDCPSLTSATIPDSVTSMGELAFCNCSSLTSIIIPDSVTSIGKGAFGGCTSLTSIKIPDSVTSIGEGAFGGCTDLTSVTIGNSVPDIGYSAFSSCTSLTTAGPIGSGCNIEYGWTETIPTCAHYLFVNCTSITISGSITSIGAGAFSECESLTSITIPNSVASIGAGAFGGCTSLTSISIPNSVTSIDFNAFSGCTSLSSIKIPVSVAHIEYGTFSGCTSLTSITIPDSVKTIGNYAFHRCTSLSSIKIGSSVTSIYNDAFWACTSLTSITIPDSVTDVSYEAFYDCTSLSSVTIGNSVTSIDYLAFAGCTSLKQITFTGPKPSSINASAFYRVAATVYYPNTWGDAPIYSYGGTITWVAYDPAEGPPV